MFSGLSKLADKSFVLGFFLPALLGTVALVALTQNIRLISPFISDWTKLQNLSNLTVVLILVWTLSVLLMAGSHWMYRVLEGYAWPLRMESLLDRQLKRRKLQRKRVRDAYAALSVCISPTVESTDGLKAVKQESSEDGVKLKYLSLKRALLLEYPEQRELVLPTRFGNVLRAFEMYAGNVYGVESIHAWPRLLAVVPKEFQTVLADSRAPVDFFVSSVFISVAVGIVALVQSVEAYMRVPEFSVALPYSGIALVAFALGRLFYLAAVSSAIAWGEVVKSAFDLYLPALAQTLGYELPKTSADRRRFWEALANQFQFHEAVLPEMWSETDAPTDSEARARPNQTGNGATDGEGESKLNEVQELMVLKEAAYSDKEEAAEKP